MLELMCKVRRSMPPQRRVVVIQAFRLVSVFSVSVKRDHGVNDDNGNAVGGGRGEKQSKLAKSITRLPDGKI